MSTGRLGTAGGWDGHFQTRYLYLSSSPNQMRFLMHPLLLLLLLQCMLAGGDLASAVLTSATAAYQSRRSYCTPQPPSPSIQYLCGFSNDTSYITAGVNPLMYGPTLYASPTKGQNLQVRTAGYPMGVPPGATSCTLVVLPVSGSSLQLTFNAFRLSPASWLSVQEWPPGATFYDPIQARYLLGGASGGALPPTISGGPSAGLVLTYYAPIPGGDPHDPVGCDGVVGTVMAVPSAPSSPACAAATSCGPCTDTLGCVWCDTAGANGLCLYTGVGVSYPGSSSGGGGGDFSGSSTAFTTPPSPGLGAVPYGAGAAAAAAQGGSSAATTGGVLCNASTAVSHWTACPALAARTAIASAGAARATAAILTGYYPMTPGTARDLSIAFTAAVGGDPGSPLSPSLILSNGGASSMPPVTMVSAAPGGGGGVLPTLPSPTLPFYATNPGAAAGAWNPVSLAFSTLLAAQAPDYAYGRFALGACLVCYGVLGVLGGVLIAAKRALRKRTGVAVAYGLECALCALAALKFTEYCALSLVISARLGDVPSLTGSLGAGDGYSTSATSTSPLSILYTIADYAGCAQYALLACLAYAATITLAGSKHGPCSVALILVPALVVGGVVGVILHWVRISPLLPPPADTIPGGASGSSLAGLLTQVCSVPVQVPSATTGTVVPLGATGAAGAGMGSSTSMSGGGGGASPSSTPSPAPSPSPGSSSTSTSAAAAAMTTITTLLPVALPTLYLLAAVLWAMQVMVLLTAMLLGVASLDTVSTRPLRWNPPLVKALGAFCALLCFPVEVLAVLGLRCVGTPAPLQTLQAMLAGVYLAPAVMQIVGCVGVVGGVVWQVRKDARVMPGLVKEGLKIHLEDESLDAKKRAAEEEEEGEEEGGGKGEDVEAPSGTGLSGASGASGRASEVQGPLV